MKIKTRILLSYLLVFGTGFYFLVYWVLGDLRLRYLESVEEVLVDQSQLWATGCTGSTMPPTRGNWPPTSMDFARPPLMRDSTSPTRTGR